MGFTESSPAEASEARRSDTAGFDVEDGPGDDSLLGDEMIEELLEILEKQLLVGKEPFRVDVVLAAELGDGGVESRALAARSCSAESRLRNRR